MENENQTGTVLQEETRIPAAAEQSVPVDALPETNVEEASQPAEEQQEKECCCCECEAEQKEQKAAPAPVIPVTAEMVEKCKTVLGTMLDYLGLDGTVKAEGKTNKINLLIASEDPGRIIGRKGQSLESLQILINRMMQKGEEQLFPKIYIDIDGYSSNSKRGDKHERGERRSKGRFKEDERNGERPRREKRERSSESFSEKDAQLQQQALDAAKEVRRWSEPVTLPPMNAHDRRIIHITLEKEEDLQTESTGEGNLKRVVISLKKVENA